MQKRTDATAHRCQARSKPRDWSPFVREDNIREDDNRKDKVREDNLRESWSREKNLPQSQEPPPPGDPAVQCRGMDCRR